MPMWNAVTLLYRFVKYPLILKILLPNFVLFQWFFKNISSSYTNHPVNCCVAPYILGMLRLWRHYMNIDPWHFVGYFPILRWSTFKPSTFNFFLLFDIRLPEKKRLISVSSVDIIYEVYLLDESSISKSIKWLNVEIEISTYCAKLKIMKRLLYLEALLVFKYCSEWIIISPFLLNISLKFSDSHYSPQ